MFDNRWLDYRKKRKAEACAQNIERLAKFLPSELRAELEDISRQAIDIVRQLETAWQLRMRDEAQ